MIVYDKSSGKIKSIIPDNQKPRNYADISKDNIGTMILEEYPYDDIRNYFVKEGSLVRYLDEELEEIKRYDRILTEEERLNILLEPTHQEVMKAETTIETMSLLQEVGLI